MRTRRKLWLLIPVAVLVGLIAALLYVRSLPVVSPEEVAEAREQIRRGAMAHADWLPEPRATFGTTTLDQAGFDALFADSRWDACVEGAGAEDRFADASDPETGLVYAWILDRGDGVDVPPEIHDAHYLETYAPPVATPEIEALEASCTGLDVLFERAVATPDLRSPFRIRSDGWNDANLQVIQTFKALALLARKRAREGDLGSALTLLVDGMLVARDLRKGPISLISAMISVACEGILGAHFATLLMSETALADDAHNAIRDRLRQLPEVQANPEALLECEREGFVRELGRSAYGDDEDVGLPIVSSARTVPNACRGLGVEACIDWLVALPVVHREYGVAGDLDFWARVFGPRVSRAKVLEGTGSMLSGAWPRYLGRLLKADLDAQILEVLLELARVRAQNPQTCPPHIAGPRLTTPLSRDPITLQHYDGQIWELSAPELRAFPAERTVAKLACPAATAGWTDPAVTTSVTPTEPRGGS